MNRQKQNANEQRKVRNNVPWKKREERKTREVHTRYPDRSPLQVLGNMNRQEYHNELSSGIHKKQN